MSRAFVINGDEWGFCREYHLRCSSADEEGKCMRPKCRLEPWEIEDARAEYEASMKEEH